MLSSRAIKPIVYIIRDIRVVFIVLKTLFITVVSGLYGVDIAPVLHEHLPPMPPHSLLSNMHSECLINTNNNSHKVLLIFIIGGGL